MFDDDIEFVLYGLLLVMLVVVGAAYCVAYAGSGVEITGTVTKTVVDRGNTYFVIQPDDGGPTEIFENEDCWYLGKMNSGDFLMNIQVGQRYTFRVAGWRIPWLSWYRNIISYRAAGQ